MYSPMLSLTLALDGSGWSASRLGHFTRGKETWYPLYKGLGGLQVQSGHVQKILPPTKIQSLHRPAYSESLHQLHCPRPVNCTALVLAACNVHL